MIQRFFDYLHMTRHQRRPLRSGARKPHSSAQSSAWGADRWETTHCTTL